MNNTLLVINAPILNEMIGKCLILNNKLVDDHKI